MFKNKKKILKTIMEYKIMFVIILHIFMYFLYKNNHLENIMEEPPFLKSKSNTNLLWKVLTGKGDDKNEKRNLKEYLNRKR